MAGHLALKLKTNDTIGEYSKEFMILTAKWGYEGEFTEQSSRAERTLHIHI